jgi:signal transduction histidine kinase
MNLRTSFIIYSLILFLVFAAVIASSTLLGYKNFLFNTIIEAENPSLETTINGEATDSLSIRKLFNVVLNKILFSAVVCFILSGLVAFLISKRFTKSFEDSWECFTDDFLISVSHEFKSPLAAIEGYSDLMLEKAKRSSSSSVIEDLNVIKNSTNRLKYFINNVLSFAQVRAGKIESKGKLSYIDKVFGQEIINFRNVADLEKKKFIIDITDKLPPVWGDSSLLGLVVSSILNNAFKFTKEGDSVSIKVMLSKNYGNKFVEVWISDTGVGIPKELLKKVFEKFYQVRKSKFEKLKGSGLGLSLAKEIVVLYHGNIWAESKVGKGTTIKFILPVFKN